MLLPLKHSLLCSVSLLMVNETAAAFARSVDDGTDAAAADISRAVANADVVAENAPRAWIA